MFAATGDSAYHTPIHENNDITESRNEPESEQ